MRKKCSLPPPTGLEEGPERWRGLPVVSFTAYHATPPVRRGFFRSGHISVSLYGKSSPVRRTSIHYIYLLRCTYI